MLSLSLGPSLYNNETYTWRCPEKKCHTQGLGVPVLYVPDYDISQNIRGLDYVETRAGVYKTIGAKHMISPNNNIEMIPNLRRAITPKTVYRFCSKVN